MGNVIFKKSSPLPTIYDLDSNKNVSIVMSTAGIMGLCLSDLLSGFFKYKKIIFSDPCTIVIWGDGSKTMVRCMDGDTYDPEKGLALCFMKKALGNKRGPFHKVLKKEVERYYKFLEAKEKIEEE